MVQEPWCRKQKVNGVPRGAIVYSGTASGPSPRAVIIASKSLSENALPLAAFSDRDLVAIRVDNYCNNSVPIIFASAYMDITFSDFPSEKLGKLITYCTHNKYPLVIGADTNAHHTAWECKASNARGEKLVNYMANMGISWANEGYQPTFVTAKSEQIIDLTLISQDTKDLIQEWTVDTNLVASDHRCIKFKVKSLKVAGKPFRNVKNTDWDNFKLYLSEQLHGIDLSNDNPSIEDIDRVGAFLTDSIAKAYSKSCPLTFTSDRCPVTWWTKELALARSKLRITHKKATSAGSAEKEELWKLYKKGRQDFKKLVRREKRKSWKKFCSDTSTIKATAKISKILRRENRSNLGSLKKNDNSYSLSPQDTIETLLTALVPPGPVGTGVKFDPICNTPPDPNIENIFQCIEPGKQSTALVHIKQQDLKDSIPYLLCKGGI